MIPLPSQPPASALRQRGAFRRATEFPATLHSSGIINAAAPWCRASLWAPGYPHGGWGSQV